jgi:guanylate kinase
VIYVHLKKYFGENALSIFVKAPSLEVLEARLRGRKTESEDRIEMRISKAKQEMDAAKDFDYILVNDDLESALVHVRNELNKFINS